MIRVVDSNIRLINIRTRLPFRYGSAHLTETPHLFCQVDLEVDGMVARGIAADSLVPKWFSKDPGQSYEQEIAAMLEVVSAALEHAFQAGSVADVFSLWRRVLDAQKQWAADTVHPPLLWNFGVSLVERAAIDAYCRAIETPFPQAVVGNLLGVDLGLIHAELAGRTPPQFLPRQPATRICVRHTVGLSDTLAEADLPPGERLQDGLPQTLEASIRAYGLRYFKIKLSGDSDGDLQRLTRIAELIQASVPRYAFTLDGNEQYQRGEEFRAFWDRLAHTPELNSFLQYLLFVEQPFQRSIALSDAIQAELLAWPEHPPLIIDESDAELYSLRRALDCGYAGTSHKNCKGVFKGLANACLLAYRRKTQPQRCFILSGEDLATVGPVALLQDLAMMATLGLTHVERNGHHYFPGLAMFPEAWQEATLAAHPDLFVRNGQEWPMLRIEAGSISLASVLKAPFGVGAEIDLQAAAQSPAWQPVVSTGTAIF